MRILSIIFMLSISFNCHAFFGAGDVKIIQELQMMYRTLAKQLDEIKGQRRAIDDIKNLQALRDISGEDVRSIALEEIVGVINSESPDDTLGEEDIDSISDRLRNMISLTNDLNDRRFYEEQLRNVMRIKVLSKLKKTSVENYTESTKNKTEREAANINANANSTMALIALEEHKQREKQDKLDKMIEFNAAKSLKEFQGNILKADK